MIVRCGTAWCGYAGATGDDDIAGCPCGLLFMET